MRIHAFTRKHKIRESRILSVSCRNFLQDFFWRDQDSCIQKTISAGKLKIPITEINIVAVRFQIPAGKFKNFAERHRGFRIPARNFKTHARSDDISAVYIYDYYWISLIPILKLNISDCFSIISASISIPARGATFSAWGCLIPTQRSNFLNKESGLL